MHAQIHLKRLLEAGFKVGVVRQTESAALKAAGLSSSGMKSGTFSREVVGVFTRATYNEDDPALAFVGGLQGSGGSGGGGGGGGGGGSRGG